MKDQIERLQEWYLRHCDGDWEHQYGVKIDTLDNPGWKLVVDLAGTELEESALNAIEIERTEPDWIHYHVRDARFEGSGGAQNLSELIDAFLAWASAQK